MTHFAFAFIRLILTKMEKCISRADNVVCKLCPKIGFLLTFQTNVAQLASSLLFIRCKKRIRSWLLHCSSLLLACCILRHRVAWCRARIAQDKNQISRYPRDDPSRSKAQVLFVWLDPLSVYLRYACVFFGWVRSSHPVWRQGWCPLIYCQRSCRAADFPRFTTQPSRT